MSASEPSPSCQGGWARRRAPSFSTPPRVRAVRPALAAQAPMDQDAGLGPRTCRCRRAAVACCACAEIRPCRPRGHAAPMPGSAGRAAPGRIAWPSWSTPRSRPRRPAFRGRDRAGPRTKPVGGALCQAAAARWRTRFLLEVMPRRWKKRHTVLCETRSPCASSRYAAISSSVMSGVSSISASTAASAGRRAAQSLVYLSVAKLPDFLHVLVRERVGSCSCA